MSLGMMALIPVLALMAGLAKGGLGPSLGGVIVPVLSIFMPVQDAIALSLPLFVVGDWLSVQAYWKLWDLRLIQLTLPTALLGIFLGTYLLANLPDSTLRVILGVLALIISAYKLLEPRLRTLRYSPRPWHGLLAGGIAGTGAALASAGGPTYSAYLLLQKLKPVPFVATSALFFMIVNLIRLPGFFLAGLFDWKQFLVLVWFMPLVWVGVRLGKRLVLRINPYIFDRLMIGLMIVAGIILIL